MSFDNLGYEVVDVSEIKEDLAALRAHCFDVFDAFSMYYSGESTRTDKELVKYRQKSQSSQHQALKQLQFCPHIFKVAGNAIFSEILISSFGYQLPNLELPPYMRCDIPVKEQSLFKQHQDYSYNIGSENSITIWIPLQNVSIDEGALLCAPGSHKMGVLKNKNGIIDDALNFDFESVSVKFGEALIFNQKLVHKSGLNISNNVRFSVILRYSDLKDEDFLRRGCPINHEITTIKYAESI